MKTPAMSSFMTGGKKNIKIRLKKNKIYSETVIYHLITRGSTVS